VSEQAKQTEGLAQPDVTRPRDAGTTFIEVLVAIVLLGTVVIATLTALQTTVIATRVSRDHSKAEQWLQSAIGVLQAYDFADCTSPADGDDVQAAYQAAITAGAPPPEGFTGGSTSIFVNVPEVWDGTAYVAFDSQTQCVDNNKLRQQLVTITVTSPDGSITEDVEVVKRDR